MPNANGIKAINHILIYSKKKKEHLNEYKKCNSGIPLLTLSELNKILTESKLEVQKMLIWSKSRESTSESNRQHFSNTSVDVQKIIVTNA